MQTQYGTKLVFSQQVEEEFRQFLVERAKTLGFSEAKQAFWAQYMTDTTRIEKVIRQFLDDVDISDHQRHRVLDVGCGFGSSLIALPLYFGQAYGIDTNTAYVEWAKRRAPQAKVVQADARAMPWCDDWFDVVFVNDMLEHVNYDDQKCVASELMRVLKPGGYGVITVPNRYQVFDEHNRVPFGTWLPPSKRELYVRAISPNEHFDRCWERTGRGWQRLFEQHGFAVTRKAHYVKGLNALKYLLVPPNRYKLYLRKPE
ncbi:MAG TPA: class I SAM-dependent methyltransferase [Crinalium sp.]|jgi:SAM-dependent methyltransferase